MSEQQRLDEISGEATRKLDLGPRSLDLPKGWSKSEFGDVFKHQRGVNYSSDNYVEKGEGMIFLTLNAIAPGGGLKKDSLKFYDDDISDEKKVSSGDVLMANTDLNQDGEIIGYPVRVPSFDSDASKCFSHHLLKIEQEEEVYQEHFLEYLLSANYVHDRMIAFSCGSTVLNLNTDLLDSLELPVPQLLEQRKIATVLYTVDRAIENAEEIETQLQRVKKGAKQRLFTYGLNNEDTQKHHIGDFPQSWVFDKVAKLADIERGNTPRTSHDEYYGGDITWVTPDDLSDLNEEGNGKYISDSGRKLTPEGVESSSLTIVEPDSVMFTSRSYGIGRTAICTVPAATNQGITAFECDESLDTEFFYYYFNYIMDYVVSISGGSTFPEISKSATGKIDVPVPDIDEQKEIASILSQFDEQILHIREVVSQLKRLKRGLMQDLLSGKIRTTDTNIEVPKEIA